jgi:hypothetical protein
MGEVAGGGVEGVDGVFDKFGIRGFGRFGGSVNKGKPRG